MTGDDEIIAVLRRLNEFFPPDGIDHGADQPATPPALPAPPPPLLPPVVTPAAAERTSALEPTPLPRVFRRAAPPLRAKTSRNKVVAGLVAACACTAGVYTLRSQPTQAPSPSAAMMTGEVPLTSDKSDTDQPLLSTRIAEGIAKLAPDEVRGTTDAKASPVDQSSPEVAKLIAPTAADRLSLVVPGEHDVASAPATDVIETVDLLQRGQHMLTNGNVQAARLLLERAAESGNAEAALSLANSYGGTGGDGNVYLARHWFQRAQALGSPDAQTKLQELGR